MDYSLVSASGALEIRLQGKVNFSAQAVFRKIIEELKTSSESRWVLVLSAAENIDSSGLGLLLRLKRLADQNNKSLVMRDPQSGQPKTMLDNSSFEDLVPFE